MKKKRRSVPESKVDQVLSEKRINDSRERKKRGMIRYFVIVVLVSVFLSALIIPKVLLTVNERLVMELTVNEVDITGFEDAVYSGRYTSSHLSCTVEVTVISGRMTDIKITDYTGIELRRAEYVAQNVIAYQMFNMPDASLGTQPTDIVLLKAIEYALTKGTMI